MRFLQRQPSPALRHLVMFYWMVEDERGDELSTDTVIPDGCMEMIFHFSSPCLLLAGDEAGVVQPRGFIGGQITRPIQIRSSGPVGMLGVRFHPFGARPLLGLAMDELQDQTVDLVDFFGPRAEHTIDRLMHAGSADGRFAAVEAFLLALNGRAGAVNGLARASIIELIKTNGVIPVGELASTLGVSRRHLGRTLREQVGLGTKTLARIMRLQSALRSMQRGSCLNLTDVCYRAGYFDQAHFSKDFREFCGVSPSAYCTRQHTLSESFA